MAERTYNLRNPSVKRILQEVREMSRDQSSEYVAEALESDIFEWVFAIRGPADSEFQGGVYVGRIILPPEYPFKPPSFSLLTPNGRFETGTKICLSISSHHPEHWQPSWSVRTALTALAAFMPTPGNGAIGSLDAPPDERRMLAAESRRKVPKHGSAERCELIERLHTELLARGEQQGQKQERQQVAAPADSVTVGQPAAAAEAQLAEAEERPAAAAAAAQAAGEPSNAAAGGPASSSVEGAAPAAAAAAPVCPAASPVPAANVPAFAPAQQQPQHRMPSLEERLLTLAAGAILAAILAILLKKVVGLELLGASGSTSM